jgi:hypothetical protein
MRPENAGDLLCLSRRTKLVLRVPRGRIDAAQVLVGRQLDVAGHALRVEKRVCDHSVQSRPYLALW